MDTPSTDHSSNPRPTLFSPAFVALLVVQFAYGTAYSTFFALPKYLIETLDAPATLVGNAHGAFAIAGAVAVPAVGAVADRFGRKPMLVGGLILGGISFAPFGWVTTPELLLLMRVLHGFAFSMVFASGGTLAVDLAPPTRRAEAVGYFGTAMLVTNAFGPSLAEVVAERYSWSAVFVLCSVYCLFALLAAVVMRTPSFSRGQRTWSVPYSLPLAGAYLASLAVGVGVGASKTFIPAIIVSEASMSLGPYFATYTVGAVVQRTLFGSLPDRLGPLRATVTALSVYALALLLVSSLSTGWLLVAAPFVGLAHGLAYPASAALSVDLCQPDERGRVTALCAGFFNLGFALSASGLAPLEPWLGYRGLVACGGATLILCSYVVLRLVNTRSLVTSG